VYEPRATCSHEIEESDPAVQEARISAPGGASHMRGDVQRYSGFAGRRFRLDSALLVA